MSTQLDYVHYDKYKNSHFKLDARAPEERYNSKADVKLKHSERIVRDLNFKMSSEIRKEDYFETYEGIEAEVLNSVKFNENKDVSTTYLGKKVMTRQMSVKC